MKVVVCGSRNYEKYDEAKTYIEKCIQQTGENKVVILSGGCHGADMLGEKYAKEEGYIIKRISPEWNKYGKAAGIVRNKIMAEEADLVICFWNGKSKGTKAMINYTKKLNKPIFINIIFE